MTNIEENCKIIQKVAEECEFEIEGTDTNFTIDTANWHSVSFLVKINSAGYIQVHQWEAGASDSDGEYGRAIYSLRNLSDVIRFCEIILISSEIHARR